LSHSSKSFAAASLRSPSLLLLFKVLRCCFSSKTFAAASLAETASACVPTLAHAFAVLSPLLNAGRGIERGPESKTGRLVKSLSKEKTFNALVGRPFFFVGVGAARRALSALPLARAARPTRAGGSISIFLIDS
jgi:hypothetical protein